ncbi:MAG: hypothetical protein AABZ64_06125 [Nitrospinota bacterium]
MTTEHRISRRGFLAWIAGVTMGWGAHSLAPELATNFVIQVLETLLRPGVPAPQTGPYLRHLFGDWKSYWLVPGLDHKDYLAKGKIHPDIFNPCIDIVPLWREAGLKLESTPLDHLPITEDSRPLVLIGGPNSNIFSRKWQGYQQNPQTKRYEYIPPRVERRWRFEYNFREPERAGPARYVDGEVHTSWQQAIKDEETNELFSPRTDGTERFLTQDWLMVNYVPNIWNERNETSILDCSDLHGQGIKAFSQLLREAPRLSQLDDMLKKRGIRPGDHFQALYRVYVDHDHDNKASNVTDFELYDVAPVRPR